MYKIEQHEIISVNRASGVQKEMISIIYSHHILNRLTLVSLWWYMYLPSAVAYGGLQFLTWCFLASAKVIAAGENCRGFANDISKCIFLNENVWVLLKNSLKFFPTFRINIIPSLVQKMAWRRPRDKPISEPMMVCLVRHSVSTI